MMFGALVRYAAVRLLHLVGGLSKLVAEQATRTITHAKHAPQQDKERRQNCTDRVATAGERRRCVTVATLSAAATHRF